MRVRVIKGISLVLVMPSKKISVCSYCGQRGQLIAKKMCKPCYQKYGVPFILCKNCNKKNAHHGRGLCRGCYSKVYRYDKIKRHNIKKYYNITYDLWKEITKKCLICGFDKVVDLHHVDWDRGNNKKSNLIGLCPNHHRMAHHPEYKAEIQQKIASKLKKNYVELALYEAFM